MKPPTDPKKQTQSNPICQRVKMNANVFVTKKRLQFFQCPVRLRLEPQGTSLPTAQIPEYFPAVHLIHELPLRQASRLSPADRSRLLLSKLTEALRRVGNSIQDYSRESNLGILPGRRKKFNNVLDDFFQRHIWLSGYLSNPVKTR